MIEFETNEGTKGILVKKMKVITAESRVDITKSEHLDKLGPAIVEGESFVFVSDEKGIAMQPVKSSNIGHLGWFSGEMFVTFKKKDGFSLYGYSGVTDTRFVDLVNSKSIGRRFGLMKKECLKTFVKFF